MEGPTLAIGGRLWQAYMVRGTIGGAVFGPAGPLAARTTYGVTDLVTVQASYVLGFSGISRGVNVTSTTAVSCSVATSS